MKQQKHFSVYEFTFLMVASLVAGYFTLRQNKDESFLNRHITDEWKGWMQIVILIYHYTGASKISVIYNGVRVLVASYLFMTGFGHFTFFYKKGDFGFSRIAKVLVRLNLLTILLSYVMDASYQSYYFSPLVTLWFFIIYGIMVVKPSLNKNDSFLAAKMVFAMTMIGFLTAYQTYYESLVYLVAMVTGTQWDTRDWYFRFSLDRWVVFIGMLFAYGQLKLTPQIASVSNASWKTILQVVMTASAVSVVGFFIYDVVCPDKFYYNATHPYVSFIPILGFIFLRNMTKSLRQTTSSLFCFFGQISLETFILQFHFWLALDTKGLLVVFPSMWWLNFTITTILFVYASYWSAEATGGLVDWFVGDAAGAPKRWLIVAVVLCVFNHLPASLLQ